MYFALLHNFNRRLRKPFSELADKMDAMSLNEPRSTEHKTSTEQRLSQLENIFSFPTANSSSFPQNHCQEFIQQLQHLSPGKIKNTVCPVDRLVNYCVWFCCLVIMKILKQIIIFQRIHILYHCFCLWCWFNEWALCPLSLCIFSHIGVTVCVMSVLGVKPGEMGNSIILSRLEKDCAPVTVHIPTSKEQVKENISNIRNLLLFGRTLSCKQ